MISLATFLGPYDPVGERDALLTARARARIRYPRFRLHFLVLR